MQYLLDLLRDYSPMVILTVAFLETLGLPLPAFPFFVLAGCLIVENSIVWPPVIIAAITGALAADLVWYYLGKYLGKRTINFICRLSANPETCVGRSQTLFINSSIPVILIAKLIPGVNTLVPSLSGIMGISPLRYIALDIAACLIWVCTGISLGLAFGRGVLTHIAEVQYALLVLMIAMFGFYVIFRIGYRYYEVKHRVIPSIEADDLNRELASSNSIILLDLRSSLDYSESNLALPGARRVPPSELRKFLRSLPKEKKIVLYANYPNEAADAKIVRTLINKGYKDIRALQGGFEEWVKLGFATMPKPSA
jgi:membrane protein DedA with SNARE-associated domain/rhodanese-related sulfurtransferase